MGKIIKNKQAAFKDRLGTDHLNCSINIEVKSSLIGSSYEEETIKTLKTSYITNAIKRIIRI